MKKWLVSLAAVAALAGCAENTAGVRVDGLTQNVFLVTRYWVVDC